MLEPAAREASEESCAFQRVLGDYSSGRPGPLVIVLGGMHGNEPGGAVAAVRVMRKLDARKPSVRGRLLMLCGNLAALQEGRRYLDRDLNRIWARADVAERRRNHATPDEPREHAQQRGMLEVLDAAMEGAPDPVIFLDLHSASAQGPPFCLIGDTLANRRIAFALHMPVILGLEEAVDGTILEYFGNLGHVAVGMEGGQHGDPATADHHEAAIWITLVTSGLLSAADAPELERHRQRLAAATAGLPAVVEVRHRHGLQPEEPFVMEPGFTNFQPVHRGDLLAHGGPDSSAVHASMRGIVLLPRYQGQGVDGFFLGRSVRPFWLKLSTLLRRTRLERVLALLPGVSLSADQPDEMRVNLRVARWLSVQIFHLLGFRKQRLEEKELVFIKRLERAWSHSAVE